MKAKLYKPTGKYRIIIPERLTGTGKRERKFFDSKPLAEAEIRRILARGNSSQPKVSESDQAAFTLAKDEGLSALEILAAIKLYKSQVMGVEKKATLEEACTAFIRRQEHEQRNIRTIYSDRQALRKFCKALKGETPMTEVTASAVKKYVNSFAPGGTRRTHYGRIKKFMSWAFRDGGYLKIDVMAGSKPADEWNSNKEILSVDDFRRILFVIAGLEPIKPNEHATERYLRLLPFYVLGGMAGVRRIEIISSNPRDPVVQWTDVYWKKNLIVIREEVGKTGLRYIPLEPAAKEWLLMAIKPSGPIVEISQSTLQRLNDELMDALELAVPDNGLRNSYASYSQSFRQPGDVAKAMGDIEATVKRYYVQTLEPGTGQAWFAIRPGMDRKILQMSDAG